jgi:hypothetical protein
VVPDEYSSSHPSHGSGSGKSDPAASASAYNIAAGRPPSTLIVRVTLEISPSSAAIVSAIIAEVNSTRASQSWMM